MDNFTRYFPFCSYHCQEWYPIEQARIWLNEQAIKRELEAAQQMLGRED